MTANIDEPQLANTFSEQQRQRMYTIVDRALNEVPEEMDSLSNDLERTIRSLNEVEQQISRAPDEATISPILEEINKLNEQKGGTQESALRPREETRRSRSPYYSSGNRA